jgi:ATP-dependent DNA helicase DinG
MYVGGYQDFHANSNTVAKNMSEFSTEITNDFSIDKIDQCFPLPTFREGQREAIECIINAFNEGKKYVLLEAPTGIGKSAIGYTLAQMTKRSYYLAPQKFLQDQLTADFGSRGKHIGDLKPMIDLKGRNAYPCKYWRWMLDDPKQAELFMWKPDRKNRFLDLDKKGLGCDEGECKRKGYSKLKYCVDPDIRCRYYQQLYAALSSSICLMNFHSFLFQSSVVPVFKPRDLLIIDEAHNAEDILMKFIEFSITDRYFKIDFPELHTVQEYMEYFEEVQIVELMKRQKQIALGNERMREADDWSRRIMRFEMLLDIDPKEWVCECKSNKTNTNRTVSIKPIYVSQFANQYLFRMGAKVLLMSATILSKNVMCQSLGIEDEEAVSFRLDSPFPVSNRKCYYRPCGAMSYKHKAQTFPKMIEEVNEICEHHTGSRGIIHTHTFEIAERLLQGCSKAVKKRLLFQRSLEFDNDKNLLLDKHKSMQDSIIIAPAMHEGLDLKDDLGRFQILCKVPYPSKADPQIAARMAISNEYYNWRTATKLVQSYGRIYRHDKDKGITYILDSNFRFFFDSVQHMLPDWFIEAIVMG